ncbi:TonB-dependent receptor [Xanthobacter sp. 126]|uniref:TonB-dependent receptor n=1 Tax=Xanthobacter sp. 126 TaxID=1131814 RepID=UPI00045E71BA|nr:TonB-dependent receptor [Xanthobacter sp. 126]
MMSVVSRAGRPGLTVVGGRVSGNHHLVRALGLCVSMLALCASERARAQSVSLPPVEVSSDKDGAEEGSEAAGYRPSTVSGVGPLGTMNILDVPYSVNVVSSALLENTLASSADDFYQINPQIQPYTTSTRGFSPNMVIRGFTLINGYGTALDGMRLQNLYVEPIEDKARIETFTGLTSFLFGPANVGGLVNYVYKRPTEETIASVEAGNYGGGSGFIHGDFGGKVDSQGVLTYRLNILGQDGDTSVDQQSVSRDLLTAAFTYKPIDTFELMVLASHSDQKVTGTDAFWSFATNEDGSSAVRHPSAPDASLNWGQPWSGYWAQQNRVGAESKWDLNDIFTVRAAAYNSDVATRNNIYTVNLVTDNSGLYYQIAGKNTNFYYNGNTAYTLVDAKFDTWGWQHKVTTGFYGNELTTSQAPTSYASSIYSDFNFALPTYEAEPLFYPSNVGPIQKKSYSSNANFVIGDDLKFNDCWSALVGLNYSTITGINYNTTTGIETSSFSQGHLSPSASLTFRPYSWLSTYVTYSQSLQGGGVVTNWGSTVYTNAGQVLSPYVGTSYEAGIKANIGQTLLTLSVFKIDQALQYSQYNSDGTYTLVQSGRQTSPGIEMTATGTVFEGFRVYGGLTLLDAQVEQGPSSDTTVSINGLRPQNVANILAKITAEYDVPQVEGLTLTGGLYYTGDQAVDILNTEFLPGVVTANLGFRLRRHITNTSDFVMRFDVKNITNESYWLNSYYLGQPRTFAFSAQVTY